MIRKRKEKWILNHECQHVVSVLRRKKLGELTSRHENWKNHRFNSNFKGTKVQSSKSKKKKKSIEAKYDSWDIHCLAGKNSFLNYLMSHFEAKFELC